MVWIKLLVPPTLKHHHIYLYTFSSTDSQNRLCRFEVFFKIILECYVKSSTDKTKYHIRAHHRRKMSTFVAFRSNLTFLKCLVIENPQEKGENAVICCSCPCRPLMGVGQIKEIWKKNQNVPLKWQILINLAFYFISYEFLKFALSYVQKMNFKPVIEYVKSLIKVGSKIWFLCIYLYNQLNFKFNQ